MVGSHLANLTPDPSFGHNLCFKYPNGSYELILDIYVSKDFQWYKEFFYLMSFDLCNCPLKIWKSIKTPTPKVGVHLGVWRFIPSLSYIPGNMKCDSWVSFLARTFANPCLGREPKARVVTSHLSNIKRKTKTQRCKWTQPSCKFKFLIPQQDKHE
jgi:hypothetical protein